MIKQPLPKIHLACSTDGLRPAMNYVAFINNKAVATDAHMLAIVDMSGYIDEADIEKLNGKLIHRNSWKEIAGKKYVYVDEDGFRADINGSVRKYLFPEDQLKFPDIEKVVKNHSEIASIESKRISIDPKFLKVTQDISGGKECAIDIKGNTSFVVSYADEPAFRFIVMGLFTHQDASPATIEI